MEGESRAAGDEQGQDRRQDRQRTGAAVVRGRGQAQRCPRLRGQDARRAVVVDARTVGRGDEGGEVVVGQPEFDQAVGQGELLPRHPGHGCRDRDPVQGGGRRVSRRPHGDGVGPRDLGDQLQRRHPVAVVDAQRGLR